MTQKKEKEFKHLVRIAGTDIKGQSSIVYGLAKIRGIGPRTARIVCDKSDVKWGGKIGDLTDKQIERLGKSINDHEDGSPQWILNRQKDFETGKDRHIIGADLMLRLREDLNRLKKIKSYKGIRHGLGLPVRGQRTRSTFRKGATVGVSRKKIRQQQEKKD